MQAGLQGGRVINGTELEGMSDSDLASAVQDVTIFARIMPE
jgi:P-type Ca2+ transporter type 2C